MSLSIRLFLRKGQRNNNMRTFQYDPAQPGTPRLYVQGSFAIIETQGGARFIFPSDTVDEIIEETIL